MKTLLCIRAGKVFFCKKNLPLPTTGAAVSERIFRQLKKSPSKGQGLYKMDGARLAS